MGNFSRIHTTALRRLLDESFELAYAAALTTAGLKPVSRREIKISDASVAALLQLGFETRIIHRRVETGKRISELVFGLNRLFLDAYSERFEGTRIEKSADSQRFEGLVFGYPACCVEKFIERPYSKNALTDEDQAMLFHWACAGCGITPILLPFYKDISETLRNLAGNPG